MKDLTPSEQQELAQIRAELDKRKAQQILPPWMSAVHSFKSGVENVTEGVQQWGANLIAPNSRYAKVLKQRGDERQRLTAGSREINPIATTVGELTGSIGASIPTLIIPGSQLGMAGRLGSLARMTTQGAAQGAAMGGMQYVPEGGSRLKNMAIGAAFGTVLPPAVVAGVAGVQGAANLVGKGLKKVLPTTKAAIDDAFYGITPESQVAAGAKTADEAQQAVRETLETKAAADELEIDISPAEASGNQVAAATQGSAGKTKQGALRMAEDAARKKAQRAGKVQEILDDVAPDGNYGKSVRDAASANIKARKQALRKAADPYYRASEKDLVPANAFNQLTKSSVITKALDNVQKTPAYADTLQGAKLNSIKVLDAVKKNIDDQIGTAKRAGENEMAKMLIEQKKKLVDVLDQYSPTYKKARSVYADDAPHIQALEESDVGVIAKLKDKDVQRIPKIIFDKADDNIESFKALRDEIYKQDPNAWNGIVRNYMRQTIDTVNADKTGNVASAFYNGLLATDTQFNKMLAATAKTPIAQAKIIFAKKVFKNLINGNTVRGAAAQASTSMSTSREALQSLSIMAQDALGGKYDKALIDVITNPKWDKQLTQILKIKNPQAQSAAFLQFLDFINKLGIIELTKPGDNKE